MTGTAPMKRLYDAANLVLLLLITYTVYSGYSGLPERIPIHFDFAGHPDRWGGRSSFVLLAGIAWGMTLLFYILCRSLPRLGRNARYLNIPHKEEFLKLPEDKRMIYWSLLAEFLSGLMVGLNLLWYLLIMGMMRIATGEAGLLPFKAILPAVIVIALVMLIYFKRLFTLPGKLVRGEE